MSKNTKSQNKNKFYVCPTCGATYTADYAEDLGLENCRNCGSELKKKTKEYYVCDKCQTQYFAKTAKNNDMKCSACSGKLKPMNIKTKN